MRRNTAAASLAALLAVAGMTAAAQTRPTIAYQGRLSHVDRTPATEPTPMTFRLFTTQTGTLPVWEETQNVTFKNNGLYSVYLGSVTDLPVASFTGQELFLGVVIGGAELLPRQRLSYVPYAVRSKEADHATSADGLTSSPFPTGMIVMWSGSRASIPSGWALCDGTNGTPNLRDRFVVGVADNEEPGATGGSSTPRSIQVPVPLHSHTATVAGAADHSHGATAATAGAHNHQLAHPALQVAAGSNSASVLQIDAFGGPFGGTTTGGDHAHTVTVSNGGAHTHTATVDNAGNAGATVVVDVLPNHYRIAFIMKL